MEDQNSNVPSQDSAYSAKVDISYSYIKTNIPFLRLYHTTVTPKPSLVEEKKGLKASLLIFHGLTEDSSNYLPLATHLAVEGTFECHLVDFRGFGYSTGIREHIDLVELQNDIHILIGEVLKWNLSRSLTLPVFIIASSYAANVVTGLLINNPDLPLAGIIMIAPAFSTHYQYSQLSIFEKLLYLYIYPLIQKVKAMHHADPGVLVKDKQELKKLIDTRFKPCPVRLITNDYTSSIIPNAGKFGYPLLMLGGNADIMSNAKDLAEFFHSCKSETQKLQMYNDCYHLLHLDNKKAEVFNDIIIWINKVLLSNVNLPVLTKLPKDLVVQNPPKVVAWGKRLLYLSALILYLALGYVLYSRYHQRKWLINLFVWPYHLLRFIYFRQWS